MTSRKLTICLLASTVMRSPLLLKMRHISFLMFSVFSINPLMSGRPRNMHVGMNFSFFFFNILPSTSMY